MTLIRLRPRKIALVATLLIAGHCQAANFIVNNNQDVPDDNPGDGICHPINGAANTCTLRAAIMEANALAGNHVIGLPSGQYTLNRQGREEQAASTGDLDILGSITIVNGTSNPPTIFSTTQDRVFDILSGASLTLRNVRVNGGVANAVGTVRGGAFQVTTGAQLTLDQVIVGTNYANIGGAIYNDGIVSIVDSDFYNNAITADNVQLEFANGAAILSRGQLTIERSTFRENGRIPGADSLNLLTSAYAIHLKNNGPASPLGTFVNTTIANNTRGVRSEGVPLKMDMVTIAGNSGLGLRFVPDVGNLGVPQLTIRQTVIADNDSTDCNGIDGNAAENVVRNRYNASTDDSCGFTGGNDFQNIDSPFFGPLDIYDGLTPVLIPRFDSEIVDAGGPLCLPSFEDQREKLRPMDGNLDSDNGCDIGAVEFDPLNDPLSNDVIFADSFDLLVP
ncbi:choice-of-anchor Q domain-containing protein [Dokdonella sp.]|uniref:choice-of-anchor Q domain-containing protein n=1 Tax=Dokdonella sp. TaxID=2291710 RepID=UPI003C5C2070